MINNKWHTYYMDMAKRSSEMSEDQNTKHGACIIDPITKAIVSNGYNGLPRGIHANPDRQERPQKYFYFEHAERNALYNALLCGVCVRDCWIYVTGIPCSDCARGIIQSGICRVICDPLIIPEYEPWKTSCIASLEMFDECGVKVLDYKEVQGK